MAERDFFPPSFVDRTISFKSPDSRWRLTRKLREKNSQLSHSEARRWPGKASALYGTFLCTNCDDASHEAVMRIVMQIPFAGSEFESVQEKAKQATEALPREARDMLKALELLRQHTCRSGPRLLAVNQQTQSRDDFVPGGFFMCLLVEKLPGKQLDRSFWDFECAKRNQIRASFKSAWIECLRVTRYYPTSGLRKIFWDEATNSLSFYDFLTGSILDHGEERVWKDLNWIYWGLAQKPIRYGSFPPREGRLGEQSSAPAEARLKTDDWG
ncbi:uncharacterized protein LDX57_002144 [Aspergillus melleus]|uniref:uncharacterized protein n=1 Tax=Aspergillus melleus TaxID=138277 RepID=UPI001E8EB604|nr:uncharacterized protein LDX57_002144 [Aspergillus melleus]KAH8424393.1 hypothetical protein LDX57_002144 [Aspergillus melleus]